MSRHWAYTLHALDFEVATRAGISVAVPLIVLALVGRLDLALYASFGAFISLYGRSEVYRTRLRTAGVAAVTLVGLVAAGVVVTALVLRLHPPVWLLIVIVTACQFGAEIFVGRHYGTALVFITPLALLMVHLSSPAASILELLFDRAFETALGAMVGVAMVLVASLVRVGLEPSRA